jgi:hypothetical protein
MDMEFSGPIIYWRGPAPFFFVALPADHSRDLKTIASQVTYGWGVIPVEVHLGRTTWTTSLFPRDEVYLVPLKAQVRKAENVDEGDTVTLRVIVHTPE